MLKEIDDDFDCFDTYDFDSFETNSFNSFENSQLKSKKSDENSNFKNDNLKYLKKALEELDCDLKEIVTYDEETSTLSISKLEWGSNFNNISIKYLDKFNKFIVQTEIGFYMLDNFNYEIEYSKRDHNTTSECYLLDIKFKIKDIANNIVFQWIDKKLFKFELEDFERCKTLVELDYSKLKYKDSWIFRADFNIFHDNKIRQVKKVIDEFIKSRTPNIDYKNINSNKKKCIVKNL